MRRKKTEDPQIEALACAFLAGKDLKQHEIAQQLGLSQATVSRLLKVARKEDDPYIYEEIRFLQNRVDEETMIKIIQRVSHGRLVQGLQELAGRYRGMQVPELFVFPSGDKDMSIEGLERRGRDFGRKVAPVLQHLLLRPKTCGIAWGSTLGEILSAMENLGGPPPRASNPIKVFPICGESLGKLPTMYSSSSLAATMEKILNGSDEKTLSIGMVPAFIPKKFESYGNDVIWSLINLVKAHHLIFGPHEPQKKKRGGACLADKAEMILTGLGIADKPLGFGEGSLLEFVDIDVKKLERLVCGDIAGNCISRPNLGKADQKKFDQKLSVIDHLWTGIKKEQIEACAKRAANSGVKKGPPGVVIAAYGANKALCALEVIKRGWASIVLMDDALEEELENLIKKEMNS